jgi:glutamate dehydrogenase
MPFLVDSVTMAVNRRGSMLHYIVHPIIRVNRAAEPGTSELGLRGVLHEDAAGGVVESFMHLEIDRVVEPAELDALGGELGDALDDVRAAVEDWKKITANVREIVAEFDRRPPPVAQAELAEARAFLEWLLDNHYTFLGYRCHDLVVKDGDDALQVVRGASLGILRDRPNDELSTSFAQLPPQARAYARVKDVLILAKANARSTVHRPGYLDYIGIKRYDERGEVCGEHRLLGLYTHTAYQTRPTDIPVVRRKVAGVQARAGLAAGGHAWKALENILETYPRDELFEATEDELFDIALGILHLGERQRFRLFVRRDRFERYVTCLIYAPRENYTTDLRRKWQSILLQAWNGTSSEFDLLLSGSQLARVLITVRTTPGRIPPVNLSELEARLAAAARRWEDDLRAALIETAGEARGNALARQFATAFPAAYREDVAPRAAVQDCETIAQLLAGSGVAMRLHRAPGGAPGALRFKLFRKGDAVALSDSMPMLERMGLRVLEERPYRIALGGEAPIWVHDFGLAVSGSAGDAEVDIEAVGPIFEEAFRRVFAGEIENDALNALVLGAHLHAEQIEILRAYTRYLRQTGFALSIGFVEQTLAAHPALARLLVNLFRLRFDPVDGNVAGAISQRHAIEQALEKVANLNEDRVLRQLLALMLATTRTNFWRRDETGRRRPFISCKLDPARVPGLPEPRPQFEIFVYSPRFEGVHLRGGKVARGGLRWSDRPEDFRTEVLGLLKAQMVKNVVIVPVGSKGGFVLKRAPSDRDALMKEGIACYQDFLRGLLDLTDNILAGAVVPPPQVRRHDGDDPYLVVAADKGTATFSDHANAIAREYGFWLDDAFASGGSAGYDHKAMGITARGAWESAKRHFRELGVDIQSAPFTVAGIGDMSGDVFGNGMLLSRHVRLVAAFDHRHIFIDPEPDAAASWAERKRLFELPRSSWADYNTMLISAGGGVWPRSAKSIPLSPQAKRALGIAADALAPHDLIAAILRAPVDLIYNGGIGTYVKSARESHADVGDRANDALRVNGGELRCKAFVEGGNLGVTQLGRVEYALAGGRINTDAIDNSAGVETSDHEVNIKILLGLVVADAELTGEQRDALLARMTDQVAALVLRDNYFQTQSLSLARRMAPQLLDTESRFIHALEKSARLNRALEFLPTEEEIGERRTKGAGLTTPERAVLLAYSKIWLYDEMLASALPEDPWIATALGRYFPQALREVYAGVMPRHPLKREIIATHVVNSMVNRVGATFVHRLMESTGAQAGEIVRAYLLQREVFGYVALWQAIEALDNKVADGVQAEMLLEAGRLAVRATAWFLRLPRLQAPMEETIEHFQPCVEMLYGNLARLLDPQAKARVDAQALAWAQAGVPAEIANRVAALDTLFAALDIAEIGVSQARSTTTVADVYFALGARLGLGWLREQIGKLPAESHWQTLAKLAMRDDLASLARTLAGKVLADTQADAAPEVVAAWHARNGGAVERAERLLGELHLAPAPDLAMLSVALRELRNLV